jgi:Lrp/AsnC family leucine-responsive transcriptional regulator
MSTHNSEYDDIDRMIARNLMKNADITSQQLGLAVGLSASAANERLRHLKHSGAIKKVVAMVDSGLMDMSLAALIFVNLEGKQNHKKFLNAVIEHDAILECHHVTGEYSYLLKIRCKNTKMLESLITDFLKKDCGVSSTFTQIILSSPKEESLVVD